MRVVGQLSLCNGFHTVSITKTSMCVLLCNLGHS